MQRLFSLFLALVAASSIQAVNAAEVHAEFVDNYDGDTIKVNLTDLRQMDHESVYSLFWEGISVRLEGIDAPELKGKCPQEKALAKTAKDLVKDLLSHAREVTIDHLQKDKYFRILGEVYADGVPVAQALLNAHLAVPYDGGTKIKNWCETERG